MYLTKTPDILKPIAGDLLWDIKTEKREIFLTFDDGPIPEVTPAVLDILDKFNAKATFFCVGENIVRHPEILEEVKRRGHLVANHTYSHEKGWDTSQYLYLKSFLKCQALTQTPFFRPPHGRIKRQQVQSLKDRTTIVMWDILSGDFDTNCTPEKCIHNVMKSARPGSIVVFHDSLKARKTMLIALPEILQSLTNLGYRFPVLRKG
ncbi:MAG: peptidoglycan/xylan/chitin deacetylase (PgdA/CDA1 family) [Flavobacteriales bacterium]|jgi:peptidoglycan/xylan/chitin deacetylase (PgdA/CDA1 family)